MRSVLIVVACFALASCAGPSDEVKDAVARATAASEELSARYAEWVMTDQTGPEPLPTPELRQRFVDATSEGWRGVAIQLGVIEQPEEEE